MALQPSERRSADDSLRIAAGTAEQSDVAVMEWVEITGRTVDEARDRALDRLGVDLSDAEVEVIEAGSRALFGLRRVEARVRVRVRPTTPPPTRDRSSRRRSQSRRGRKSNKDGARSGSKSRGPDGEAQRRGGASKATKDKAIKDKDRKRGASRPTTGRSNVRREEQTVTEEVSLEDQGSIIVEFLDGLLGVFELDGSAVVATIDDSAIEVAVSGDDLGLLIGPGGHTLSALAEVTKTVLQRQCSRSNRARVRLDVAGYREKRRAALTTFTLEVAESVKSSGEPRALEPMHSADRKIVHDAVNEIEDVGTISDGDEPRRRVVLVPES